ncbi:MAG: hypothetical protein ACMXYG_05170 [Candidatus Woesearchaeota archaeon]
MKLNEIRQKITKPFITIDQVLANSGEHLRDFLVNNPIPKMILLESDELPIDEAMYKSRLRRSEGELELVCNAMESSREFSWFFNQEENIWYNVGLEFHNAINHQKPKIPPNSKKIALIKKHVTHYHIHFETGFDEFKQQIKSQGATEDDIKYCDILYSAYSAIPSVKDMTLYQLMKCCNQNMDFRIASPIGMTKIRLLGDLSFNTIDEYKIFFEQYRAHREYARFLSISETGYAKTIIDDINEKFKHKIVLSFTPLKQMRL